MKSTKSVADQIEAILDLARLAPSVHNTQPWRVSTEDNVVAVSVDPSHRLAAGDPTGRQTTISLGIFCEAIIIAAGHYGFAVRDVDFKPDLVHLTFANSRRPAKQSDELLSALKRRATDRSVYRPAEVDAPAVKCIERSALRRSGITTRVVTDPGVIQAVADLTSHGIGLALSNPKFRAELSHYLVLPGSTKKRGIAVSSLYLPAWLAMLQPVMVRLGLNTGAETKTERQRWLSASAVVVILGDGDSVKYWFNAGRSYLQASLAIEQSGFSQATSAAIVEASNYHDDIEELLGTKQRILGLIRVGRGSRRRHYSPRVSAQDLLTSP